MPNEPLDVIDFVVNKGNGVKALSDLSLSTVPPEYILPIEERLGDFNTKSPEAENLVIPIIDISSWEESQNSICEAAKEWGFFQIINHGIPDEVLENVLESGHHFFGLPVEERREYFFRNTDSDCRLKTSFIPHVEKVMEWKDFLSHTYSWNHDNNSFGQELEEEVEEGSKIFPKHFSNWPSVSRDQVLEYINCAKPVIKKIFQALMKGLKVENIDECTEKEVMATLIVNLSYCPKCPDPDLTYGVGPHADVSTITILIQDDTGGLYVRSKKENVWIPIEPVKGALVINIGDVMQIMSNDRYHSIEHRVRTSSSNHRISVPIFVNPAPDAVVGTLNEALEIGEKPIYKQIVYSDYFNYFFSKPLDGKRAIEYAKI